MNAPVLPKIKLFLASFFSPPNQLTIDKDARVGPWTERIGTAEPLATVLPCWRGGQVVDWYAIAFNERQYIALGESLTAFVGPTYTTFRGQRAELDLGDPIDAAVHTLTGGLAYKFRGDPSAGAASSVWQALERMRNVWARRPTDERLALNAVGLLVRDFYMALQAKNETDAKRCLFDLRDQHHLDSVNFLYLQVQFLTAFGRDAEVLRLPLLDDLLRLRRPLAVSQALIGAVYRTELTRFEATGDARGAAAHFRSAVYSAYSSLFAVRAGMQNPEALKSFMLHAVSQEPPLPELRDELLAVPGITKTDAAYLEEIAKLLPAQPSLPEGDPFERARGAALESRFDEAFLLAKRATSSVGRARLLCECALELGTLEARSLAVAAVQDLPAADQQTFLQGKINQQLWSQLTEDESLEQPTSAAPSPAEPVPNDWCAWIEYLDRNEAKKGTKEIARQGASEWLITELRDQPDQLARFLELLQSNRSQAAERILRECLPHLLAFFRKDEAWPNTIFRDAYRFLFDLLFVSTDGSASDCAVFNELLEALLALGAADAARYREVVSSAKDLWDQCAAPMHLDHQLDTLELLVIYPAGNPPVREDFFLATLITFGRFRTRIRPEQLELFRLLAEEIAQGELFRQYFPDEAATSADEDDPIAALDNVSLAVYTLTERAAKQFQAVIEKRCPGARISLCHDKEATRRLKQLSQQADIFVMVWASATHAATDCIQANRPEGKPLLRPSGKGAASMLRAVREHLAT